MTNKATDRRAAVLMCVLVLLFITGLIMHQTLQALMLVRRGDGRHLEMRQARELVELGRLVIANQQSPSEADPATGRLPLELNLQLDADRSDAASVLSNRELAHGELANRESATRGSLRVESTVGDGTNGASVAKLWKITVRYPLGNDHELTVIEELTDAQSP